MLQKLVSIFKDKELRKRILFTLVILLIFRIGCTVVVPGVDSGNISFQGNDLLNLMDILGGGNLNSFSVFALGISPLVTASIIVQLLSFGIIKSLKDLTKQGQQGQKKIEKTTRYVSIAFAILQAIAIIKTMEMPQYGLRPVGHDKFTPWDYVFITTVLVAGSMIVIWLSDRITQNGIGNGVSMIIFFGTISSIPHQFHLAYDTLITLEGTSGEIVKGITKFALYLLMYLVMIIFVCFIEKSYRKIPLQKTEGLVKMGKDVQNLPIKLNPSGVMPVIFASSFMTAIKTILILIQSNISSMDAKQSLEIASNVFSYDKPVAGVYWGLIIYIGLILLFDFFWTNLQLSPEDISENFISNSTFIPGVRQGKQTEKYLFGVINRVTLIGGIALVLVAVTPILLTVVFHLNPILAFGGTTAIILVDIPLEINDQINAKLSGKELDNPIM